MLNNYSCIDLAPRLSMPGLLWLRQGLKLGSLDESAVNPCYTMLNHHSCIDLPPPLLMPHLFWLRQGQKRGSRRGAKRSPWKRQGLLRHVHASDVGKPVLPMPAAETCFSTLAGYSGMDLAPRLSMPGLFWLRQEQKRASRRGARRFPWQRQGLLQC